MAKTITVTLKRGWFAPTEVMPGMPNRKAFDKIRGKFFEKGTYTMPAAFRDLLPSDAIVEGERNRVRTHSRTIDPRSIRSAEKPEPEHEEEGPDAKNLDLERAAADNAAAAEDEAEEELQRQEKERQEKQRKYLEALAAEEEAEEEEAGEEEAEEEEAEEEEAGEEEAGEEKTPKPRRGRASPKKGSRRSRR